MRTYESIRWGYNLFEERAVNERTWGKRVIANDPEQLDEFLAMEFAGMGELEFEGWGCATFIFNPDVLKCAGAGGN